MSTQNLKERLLKYSKWNGDCLESTFKARSQSGYAIMKYGKTTIGAHRASWIIEFGQIPKGIWVLHKCDNPICINPKHLFLGTALDNSRDMVDKNRHNFNGATIHSQEIVDNAIDMRKKGKTHKEIAKHFSISMGSLNNFFRRNSSKEKVKNFYAVPKYPQEIKEKAFHLRESGTMYKDIQKILNIPKRSLTRIMKEFKLKTEFLGL